MLDDLDALLRNTMKTLDDQVPSGYFEALPERTLARLAGEEADMQTTQREQQTSSPPIGSIPSITPTPVRQSRPSSDTGTPPMPESAKKPERDDSGLHDIRNLAQSTKQRLSSRRVSTHPPVGDEDVLATSSASWKNLALPQPAKMVSLPELGELPSKDEVLANEKRAKKERAAQAKANPTGDATIEAKGAAEPGTAAAIESQAFASFANRGSKKRNTRTIALVGMGLAAAAGAVLFVATRGDQSKGAAGPTQTVAAADNPGLADHTKQLERATAELQAKHDAEAAQLAAAPATGDADAKPQAQTQPVDKPTTAPSKPSGAAKHVVSKKGGVVDKLEAPDPVETPKAPEPKKPAAKGEPGDPSFDDLLKEAGVDQKKEQKPKLEKKSLSGDDFKSGMGAIAAKAQGCYKGTQGTAAIKLTIAPSGHVSKVTVSGLFAGKPEADCVVSAVKSASFPAWDGGPQSFGYSYLLSE